ncbi:TniQ family protein, partial [Brachybacterium alimentarium]|uniref:TniQ family protein n=1 Tax=Brachybacterium alimentarium TaxID=47845 RepID=UPI003FCEF757
VQLLVRCPECGAVPFSRSIWMTAATPPWICPQLTGQQPPSRRRRNRCGYDLCQAPTSPLVAPEADALDRLKTAAEAAAAHSLQPVNVAGFGVTARDHLDAVLELIDERSDLLHVLTPGAPESDDLLSSAQLAFEVLDQPTAHAAADIADRHGLLDPNGRHTPIVTDARARRRPHNPLLAAIRLQSLEDVLSPTAQLTFRLATSMPRYPEPIPWWPDQVQHWLEQVPLAVIPQVLWPGTLTPWIQDDDIPARAASAMLLAKIGSTRAWSLIALDLGLPAAFATTPNALVTRMRRNGTWQQLLKALENLATRLADSPPPIDYSARRWAAEPTLIEQAVQSIEIDTTPGITVDRNQLAVLLWQSYTGGDARYHPDYGTNATPLEARTTSRTHDALVDSLIERAAAELHHLTGQPDHGPLEWRPP